MVNYAAGCAASLNDSSPEGAIVAMYLNHQYPPTKDDDRRL